jgi:hypothetical protein
MRYAATIALTIGAATVAALPGSAQEPQPQTACPRVAAKSWTWVQDCFPRCGCPDDYCPRPLPRQCWPPYPCYYQCVPAGDGRPVRCESKKDGWSLWFLPTPRTLRDAVWCSP